ncbi:MAG: hypothetical protein BGO39_05045 [Chloroflexi bacterium 54-19]|nr:MAG: hypothetical protein BGO39_05045 [Chloroflexi bacterium 54-19]
MNQPFELSKLADEYDLIELCDRSYPIKGPGEFRLVPLARLSLKIERFYESLKVKNPDLAQAENQLDTILNKICPVLVADNDVFDQVTLEEKLEVLETFNRLGEELNGGETEELPLNPEIKIEPPEPTDWFKVIPRLQQFYRGSPLDWFRLKMKWLVAFSNQMESLKAEHILNLSQASLVGSWPENEEQRDAIEQLTQQLEAIVTGSDNQVQTQEEIMTALGNIGFTVRRVEAEVTGD